MHVHAKAIRYFDSIRRLGSIRAAARHLHVDPSAVNRQLLNLEEDIGSPLFDRMPKGLHLTQAGEIFAQHVITVLQDEQRTQLELARLRGMERGEVRLASAEGLNTDFLPNVLETMMSRYPGIHIQTFAHGSTLVGERVLNGDADIGVAFSVPPRAELRCIQAGQFSLGAIMAPDHPLAKRADVDLSECVAYPLILASPGVALHTLLEPLLAALPSPSPSILHTDSIELMRQLVARKRGVAFHTRVGLDALLQNGRLVYRKLRGNVPVARLGIYVRAERILPSAIEACAALVSEELQRFCSQEDAA